MQIVTARRVLRTAFAISIVFLGLAFAGVRAWAQTDLGLQSMKLVAGQSGWLAANDRLFWTTTLGAKWVEITPPSPQSDQISGQLQGIYFNATGSGWVVETSLDPATFTVQRTSDQGAHWTSSTVESPFQDGLSFGGAASPFFVDEQHGWLMLSVQSSSNFRPGILFRTEDGGSHWSRLPDPPVGGDLVFTDTQHGFMGPGPRGDELFSTMDGGLTWQAVAVPSPAGDPGQAASAISLPKFINASSGTLLRTYPQGSGKSSIRYESNDGGRSWRSATVLAHAQSSAGGMPSLLAADGSFVTPPTPSAQATFSTAMQGWILTTTGACSPAGVCTQTTKLRGTLDGGKTFFSLGAIPGISLTTTKTIVRPASQGAVSPVPQAATQQQPSAAPLINQMGFDKCEILTVPQMQDWYTNSPYRAVGAYIGGISRACTNVGFTPGWAATILAQGWGIIPIWVGPQAPNSTFANKIGATPAAAAVDGTIQADLAAAQMAVLGFIPGSVVYYDMEAYTRNASSIAATQAFVNAWTLELHAKGYVAAIYSSHPEIADWDAANIANSPDAIWFAFFFSSGVPCGTRCQNTVSADIPAQYWANDQRLRQTSSSFTSTYGSTAASIDEDWTDGPVTIVTGNRLTVATAGPGLGGVTSADAFLSCGAGSSSVCSAVYAPGTTVTLTATPSALSTFAGWTGCTSTSGAICTVSLTAAGTVTATFNVTPPVFTLTSTVSSLTWVLGKSASAPLTLTPSAPYQGTFTFACPNLPSFLACAFAPATVIADGSGSPLTDTLTFTVTSAITQSRVEVHHTRWLPQFALLASPLLLLSFGVRRRKVSRLFLLLLASAAFGSIQLLTGCSDTPTPVLPLFDGTVQVVATSSGTSQQLALKVKVTQ